MSLERFRTNTSHKPDLLLALLVFCLAIFGLIMIYSSSVVISYDLFKNNHYYLDKQGISLLISLVLWYIFSKIDYRFWQKHAFAILLVGLGLLVAIFIPGIGASIGGAKRWIYIGGQYFQSSEFVKLAVCIYLSAWFSKRNFNIREFKKDLLPFIAIISLIFFLIMKQPDMGTGSIIVFVCITILLVSGIDLKLLFSGIIGLAGVFYVFIRSSEYRWHRFLTFLNPEQEKLGISYHINQSLIAIGSGGLLGLGFGQSKQKFLYLPSAHTDSIFAIIVEELGLLRVLLVLLAYVLIAWRGYRIAKFAPDKFGQLLATGITTWIVAQAFVNISAMTGLMPLTGVPLPFISYGGSSLMVLFAAVGILINISKYSEERS